MLSYTPETGKHVVEYLDATAQEQLTLAKEKWRQDEVRTESESDAESSPEPSEASDDEEQSGGENAVSLRSEASDDEGGGEGRRRVGRGGVEYVDAEHPPASSRRLGLGGGADALSALSVLVDAASKVSGSPPEPADLAEDPLRGMHLDLAKVLPSISPLSPVCLPCISPLSPVCPAEGDASRPRQGAMVHGSPPNHMLVAMDESPFHLRGFISEPIAVFAGTPGMVDGAAIP